MLQAAFASADPKRAEKTDNLTVFFTILESVHAKAACRTLMKLTPGFDFPNCQLHLNLFNLSLNQHIVAKKNIRTTKEEIQS